jgi:hypothetical protein
MNNYSISCSSAVLASSINDDKAWPGLMKKPWLHFRAVSISRKTADGKTNVKWYGIVYVWDTREIEQVLESAEPATQPWGKKTPAVDNNQPLKDGKHMLPNWLRPIITGRKHLGQVTGHYDIGTEMTPDAIFI